MRNFNNDYKKGKIEEKKTLDFLNNKKTIFGELFESENPVANFDFYNDKFHVEHKRRWEIEFNKCRFPTLYFDYVKYKRYKELIKEDPEKRCFIIWACNDGRYCWEFKPLDYENEKGEVECYTDMQFNQDRGKGYAQDTHMIHVFKEDIHPISDFFKIESI